MKYTKPLTIFSHPQYVIHYHDSSFSKLLSNNERRKFVEFILDKIYSYENKYPDIKNVGLTYSPVDIINTDWYIMNVKNGIHLDETVRVIGIDPNVTQNEMRIIHDLSRKTVTTKTYLKKNKKPVLNVKPKLLEFIFNMHCNVKGIPYIKQMVYNSNNKKYNELTKNEIDMYKCNVFTKRNKTDTSFLLKITEYRWLFCRSRFTSREPESYKYLAIGNLSITFFIMCLQYNQIDKNNSVISRPRRQFDIKRYKTLYAFNSKSPKKYKGSNYFPTHDPKKGNLPGSFDIFMESHVLKSFEELKIDLVKQINYVMKTVLDKNKVIKNVHNTKLVPTNIISVLNNINKSFERNQDDTMFTFWTHNMGMYQYIALLGPHEKKGYTQLSRFTGNCAIKTMFRIMIFQYITKSYFTNVLNLVSQTKPSTTFTNKLEVCHYGLRAKNMTANERMKGGNFQNATFSVWSYMQTALSSKELIDIYDIMSTQSMFRAKLRLKRNKNNNKVDDLRTLNDFFKNYMKTNVYITHKHVVNNPISINNKLNTVKVYTIHSVSSIGAKTKNINDKYFRFLYTLSDKKFASYEGKKHTHIANVTIKSRYLVTKPKINQAGRRIFDPIRIVRVEENFYLGKKIKYLFFVASSFEKLSTIDNFFHELRPKLNLMRAQDDLVVNELKKYLKKNQIKNTNIVINRIK